MNKTADILTRHDAGQHAAMIAAALDVSPGYVYGVLRDHRPERTRKPRTRTSTKAPMIRGLHGQGIPPRRIAFLCDVSPAYVYRILSEA